MKDENSNYVLDETEIKHEIDETILIKNEFDQKVWIKNEFDQKNLIKNEFDENNSIKNEVEEKNVIKREVENEDLIKEEIDSKENDVPLDRTGKIKYRYLWIKLYLKFIDTFDTNMSILEEECWTN